MYNSENSLRKRDVINHIDELEKNENDNTQESNMPNYTTKTATTIINDYNAKECDRNYLNVQGANSTNSNSTTESKMCLNELKINENSSISQPELRTGQNNNNLWTMFTKSFNHKHWLSDAIDIILRAIAVVVFVKLETQKAFKRKIHMEELWLYQNPRMPDIVTPAELLLTVILVPFLATLLLYFWLKDIRDFRASSWVWTLALCLNGLTTSTLKVTFGRPRPDFYYRCFPDGVMVLNNITDPTGIADIFNCTGDIRDINEGRKSFPSGHASFAFTSFGFITLYMGTKLHAFNARGRGQTWRLCLAVLPLVLAALVAVSRTCDYHHHWQDVVVGSIIGLISVYIAYRQYYPSIFDLNAERPLARFLSITNQNNRQPNGDTHSYKSLRSSEEDLQYDQNEIDESNILVNYN